MKEVLSKTYGPKMPLGEQEFFELRLFEKANLLKKQHCVGQTHAAWSEIDCQVMFDGEEVDYFWNLAEVKRRFVERKLALAAMGFIYLDED